MKVDVAQASFDFLIPYRKGLLTTEEAAKCIGREQDFVRALVDEGRLEAHRDSALGTRLSNRITRRSVVVYLASTAKYDPEAFIDSVLQLLETLSRSQLLQIADAAKRRAAL